MSLATLNRSPGKHSVTLDLKAPGALEVFADLVRARRRRRRELHRRHRRPPRGRLRGGPGRERTHRLLLDQRVREESDAGVRAMDTVIQAMSGLMMANGGPDDPPIRVGIPIADNVAPLFVVVGILAALHQRDATGNGPARRRLDARRDDLAGRDRGLGGDGGARPAVPDRATLPRLAPFGLFSCRDGHVAIVAPQDKMAHDLLGAMGREDLLADPRYRHPGRPSHPPPDGRGSGRGWTSDRTVEEVLDALPGPGSPSRPVRTQAEALNDPRVLARGETRPVTHPTAGVAPGSGRRGSRSCSRETRPDSGSRPVASARTTMPSTAACSATTRPGWSSSGPMRYRSERVGAQPSPGRGIGQAEQPHRVLLQDQRVGPPA